MANVLFYQLHLAFKFELDSVEKRLNRLLAGDYPTGSAVSFMKRLLTDLQDQRDRVLQILNDLAIDPKGAFDRLISEHRKLILRSPTLVYLENAQTLRVPWSLVPSIETLARNLLPGRLVITTAGEEFNYSISWSLSGSLKEPWAFLFVPASHRIDAFLHVLVGHELFHPLLESFLDFEQATVVGRLRQECENYLSGQPRIGPPFEKRRLDQMVESVRAIWRRALEELLCDCGGAAIFGPAAVLASVAFFLSAKFDDPPLYPDYYPPFRYRLRAMLASAFQGDWGEPALHELLTLLNASAGMAEVVSSFQEYWQIIQDEAAKTSDLAELDSNILTKIAYAEVGPVLIRGWEYVKGLLCSTCLDWLQGNRSLAAMSWIVNYREVLPNIRNLRRLVPCGEIGTLADGSGDPSTISGIALAAWMNQLFEYPSMITDAPDKAAEKYVRACRLFLKSLEDAELKREFLRSSAS